MVLGCMCSNAHEFMKCDEEKRGSRNNCTKTRRRLRCPIAPKLLSLAEPRDVQFVTARLVSSGTIRGEPGYVPRNASIASELAGKVSAIGQAGSRSPSNSQRNGRAHHDAPELATRHCGFGTRADFAPSGSSRDCLSDCG